MSVVWMTACGTQEPYVQFTNGFEFDVDVKLTDGEGNEKTMKIPAEGRVGVDLSGKYTIEFSSPIGPISKRNFEFATVAQRKKGCFEYVNVHGSAAIVEQDIAYGIDIAGGSNHVVGEVHAKVCPRWGLETDKPPEAVTVKDGTMGVSKTWLHYVGDGDWHASIDYLLALPPAPDDRWRIEAWNIAVAVAKHDPYNPRLAPLGPAFLAACDRMIDMFEGTNMEGNARSKCVQTTKSLFKDL